MLYIYRFRLYLKREQTTFLNRQIRHCRFVYNKILEIAKEAYKKEGKKWNCYDYKKLLPSLKKEFTFLKEGNSQSLQEAVKQFDKAFKNFLKHLQIFQSHLQNYVVNVVTKTQTPSSLIGVGYVQSVKPMIEMLMQR